MPSGTLHGVTSDNSDSTYALWAGSGAPLVLQTAADAPPAGERRHQARVRVRGEGGSAWWAVRLQNGGLTGGAAAELPASPATVNGSWGFGLPPDNLTILAAHIIGTSAGVKITEVYIDIDTRLPPDFTLRVRDGAGISTTTVSDTATPSLFADLIDTDDLPQRQYRFWVTQGATIVWDSGIVSGAAAATMTTPLENGSYTAHGQVWSALGGSSGVAYASPEETLAFTVSVGEVQKPPVPQAEAVPGTPFYTVEVCAPNVTQLDGDVGYVEIQRVDCAASDNPTSTTIAMLGPLGSDECASWTDYTVPRTGLGGSCTEPPEECCSYYRARTIGRINGSIVISTWSDQDDPGLSSGLIFLWPSTEASIPAGWDRVPELDSRYVKGVATASTQPGATGGATTHTHTVPTHTHDISHLHTAGNTSAAVGTAMSGAGGAGTQGVPATHTHTRPNTSTTTLASPAVTPPIATQSNDLDRLDVIFIESDGTPGGVPNGALGYAPDVSLAGWTDYANANNRFIKGAAPGGNGGGFFASGIIQHTHIIGDHVHAGVSHTHTSADTGNVAGTLSLTGGAGNSVTYSVNHAHAITVNSASTADLTGGSSVSGQSSAGLNEPPWKNVRVKQNTSGGNSLPVGIIAAWRGSLGTIPAAWHLCDGTGGTIDLTARYPKGATSSIGTTGGSLDPHTHSSPSHTHTTTSHVHTETIGPQNGSVANAIVAANVSVALGTHTHTGNTNATTPTVGGSTSGTLAAATSEPPFEEVAFVQLMTTPTPAPPPPVHCLEWSDDEHLIRTEGPDGPIWAPVIGTFEWQKDRPFTSAAGVEGTRFVVSAPAGERNLRMTAAVESEAELEELQAVLRRPLVLISPSDSREVWGAPISTSVQVIKVGRIRQVTAEFIGTGPQPGPQVADI